MLSVGKMGTIGTLKGLYGIRKITSSLYLLISFSEFAFLWMAFSFIRTGSRDLVLNRRQIIFTDWFIYSLICCIAVNSESAGHVEREGP